MKKKQQQQSVALGEYLYQSNYYFCFRYTLVLAVDNGGSVTVLQQDIKIVILFNPWCSGKFET